MPFYLLPPIAHLGVTKSLWILSTKLSTLCHKFSNMPIRIGGDMNLPDFELENEQLTINQYTHSISYSFLDALANTGLQQIVNFPTKNNNTLDVALTNCPSLVKQCVGMPGASDHDIVFVETSSCALCHKPASRKIILWKHANFNNIRLKISNWTRDFISSNNTFTLVENLATFITDSLSKIVSDNVPSKFSTRRLEQCWTTILAKRMCRRIARAFRIATQTKNREIGSQTGTIFLDFAKTFDKVSYQGLLIKVYYHGVCGHTFKWT